MSDKAKKDLNLEVPHYAALVVVDSDRKQVLLAKRTEDGLWTGPGGGGHWGETPVQTAVREAFEEANLRIDPAELTPLPANLCKNGKICHCFLVVLNKVPELSVIHDPDKEVRAWKWFPLDERLPETSEARARTLIHAKMKLFGLMKSRGEGSRGGKVIGHTKSGKPIYDDHKSPAHVSFDSQDHSDAADARNQLVYKLMEAGKGTADPQVKRHMSRRDFHRMAAESMKKSVTLRPLTPDEIIQGRGLIELMTKSRKAFPIGTVRDWGGQKYVKHADGWVAVGGKHHGKLMGKFKEAPTHTEHASLHEGKQPVPDTKDPHTLFAEMGAQAFAEGGKPIPAQNKKLMEALKQHPDQISELMEAWSQGWHRANAKAPVPDDKPIVPKEEPKAPEKQSKPKQSKPAESQPKEAAPEKKPEAEKPAQQGSKPPYFSQEMHDRLSKPMTMQWASDTSLVLYYGDGSASRYSIYKNSTDSKEAAEERAQRMIKQLEVQQNAYKLSQAEWMQAYRKNNNITRFTASHKQNAILQHRRSMEAAIQAGLKSPQDASEYPELQQKFGMSVEETLPPEIDRGPQSKSNLIRSVDFSKVPKKTQQELYDYLNNCNKLVAEMGIRFKTPVAFACSGAVNKKKSVRGTHSSSSNTITLKDASQCSTTLMHEIGHAFDYAMQDQRTMPRGKQQSQGRMAELSVDKPEKLPPGELGEKFKELFDTITNSEFYQAMGKDAEKNFFRYISEPTEVFARAFEVYSVAVGKRMQAAGKLDAEFVESLAPAIYQAKNPEYVAAMEKLKGAMEKYNQASVKMRDRRMTLGGQVAGEHKLPSESDFDTFEAYQTEAMKVHVKRNEVIEERLKSDEQYQAIMAEVAAANVEKEKLMEERRTHSPYSPLKDDRKAEYEKKITDLMDYIIKNDKIRKALQKLVLFVKGENYDEEESTREGYVVGQTSSGKDVYNKFNHESHQNFDEQDNQDAAELNRRKMRTLGARTNQEQLRRYLMRQIAGFKAKLRKAMGEGSRGGHIIGRTKTGKPIYSKFNHPMHSGFSPDEHREAAASHKKLLPTLKPQNPGQAQQFRDHIGRQIAAHEAAAKPKGINVQAEAAKIKEKMKKALLLKSGKVEHEGQRGGVVVGHRKDGSPIYESQVNEKKRIAGKLEADDQWNVHRHYHVDDESLFGQGKRERCAHCDKTIASVVEVQHPEHGIMCVGEDCAEALVSGQAKTKLKDALASHKRAQKEVNEIAKRIETKGKIMLGEEPTVEEIRRAAKAFEDQAQKRAERGDSTASRDRKTAQDFHLRASLLEKIQTAFPKDAQKHAKKVFRAAIRAELNAGRPDNLTYSEWMEQLPAQAIKNIDKIIEGYKGTLKKAIAESPVAGVDINTAEHSLDDMASRVSPWVERLRRELQGFEIGDTSRVVRLNGKWELVASQEDDGIYSGFVRNADAESGDFGQVVFEVKKMTLPQMVQALRAKEYIDSSEDRQPQDPNRGLQSAILLKLQELNAQLSRVEINQLQEKLRKFAEKR